MEKPGPKSEQGKKAISKGRKAYYAALPAERKKALLDNMMEGQKRYRARVKEALAREEAAVEEAAPAPIQSTAVGRSSVG